MQRPQIEDYKPRVFYRALIEDWKIHHHFNINSIRPEFNSEFSGSHLTLTGRMIKSPFFMDEKPVEISINEDLSDNLDKRNREFALTGKWYKAQEIEGGAIEKVKGRDEYEMRFFVPSAYFFRLALSMDALLPAYFIGHGREWERNGAYLYDFDIKAYREGEPVNIKGEPVGDREVKIKNALKKVEVLEKEIQRIKGNLNGVFDQ